MQCTLMEWLAPTLGIKTLRKLVIGVNFLHLMSYYVPFQGCTWANNASLQLGGPQGLKHASIDSIKGAVRTLQS